MATIQLPAEQTPEFQSLLQKIENIGNERLAEAIPKELFEPKVWRGMVGFFASYALYVGALVGVAYAPHWILYLPLWLAAGLGAWGLFCINHDCGHNSFSRSRRLNRFLGQVCLLPILFPFHGWRHMHNLHHANTNHLELDTDWRPVPRAHFRRMNLWDRLVYAGTRSWFWWLGTVDYQRHCFQPGSFPRREARNEVRWSVTVVLLFAAVYLPTLVYFTGLTGLLLYFVAPWVAFHVWFSTTTMMHHTSNELPFLTKQHWTANASRLLLTIDYKYPRWLHFLTHNISVHTAHHVAPILPFYNLVKAREALKRSYPDMVREKRFTFRELFRIVRTCHFYDPVHGYYVAFGEPERPFPGQRQGAALEPNH